MDAAAQTLPGMHRINPKLLTGGQPQAADLQQLQRQGIERIINLRPSTEFDAAEERALSEALGLEYIALPIAGADDITPEHAAQLAQWLEDDKSTFLHCASGNRVGALLALDAYLQGGSTAAEALQLGERAGMTSLRPVVKSAMER